jgi:hypothetical protein
MSWFRIQDCRFLIRPGLKMDLEDRRSESGASPGVVTMIL